ncbi:MAG: DUF2264 domain-containing protein [Blastocatellia bacterium]|nr:DUF2264 domain-containing protein [Blastocatellia bacterium]
MDRRQFMVSSVALIAGAAAIPVNAADLTAPNSPIPGEPEFLDDNFLTILNGFLRNAQRTSDGFAVCEFPEGTVLKGCCNPAGKTYVSVARMLPAMAAWVNAAREPSEFIVGGNSLSLREILLSIYRTAFDPAHPDFWGNARSDKADQKQVEASIAAYSMWLLGDDFLRDLGPASRTHFQAWLASCTVVPEHKHNHAWFSALNQAVRLELGKRWPEFSGDEAWMRADLEAIEKMAVPDGNGWYNDYPGYHVFDYYNFWAFASHFLLWNHVVGNSYRDIAEGYIARLKEFLPATPNFFGSNGSQVMYGRSLIYRWGTLTPLVLAYMQGMWPHSPGLLRALVRRHIDFFWKAGAWDAEHGKLRETFAVGSSPDVKEGYIDNGHPYWCMQAYLAYLIPPSDPFWTAPEEPLPVEVRDFRLRFPALGMVLMGKRRSGQVRWLQSKNLHKPTYHDKYLKFSYSSHFPFNVRKGSKHRPWDQTLIFRDPITGESAARLEVVEGKLLPDNSLVTHWRTKVRDFTFDVTTHVRTYDEFEERMHTVIAPKEVAGLAIEILEGSYSLGLDADGTYQTESGEGWQSLQTTNGYMIATWNLGGFDSLEASESLDPEGKQDTNILYPRMVLNTLRGVLRRDITILVSRHYASPKPLALKQLLDETRNKNFLCTL